MKGPVVLLPFMVQFHLIPFLHFARFLHSRSPDLPLLLVSAPSNVHLLRSSPPPSASPGYSSLLPPPPLSPPRAPTPYPDHRETPSTALPCLFSSNLSQLSSTSFTRPRPASSPTCSSRGQPTCSCLTFLV